MIELAASCFNLPEKEPETPKSRAIKLGRPPVAIVAVPGSWHTKEHMAELEESFTDAGYRVVVPNLNMGIIGGSPKTWAEQVACSIEEAGVTNVVFYGESVGADTVNWVPVIYPSIEVEGFFYGNGGLSNQNLASVEPQIMDKYRSIERNTQEFWNGIERRPKISEEWGAKEGELGLTWFSKEAAPRVFYNRADPEDAKEPVKARRLSGMLRHQWRTTDPLLMALHPAGKVYLRGEDDMAIDERWAASRAAMVGADYLVIPKADHILSSSAPAEVTKHVDAFVRSRR